MKGIPLAKEGLVFVVPSLVLSLLFLAFHLYVFSLICFFLLLFFLYFFRHPQRVSQSAANLLICPADGRVMGIDELEEKEFIKGSMLRVSIFMGLADVHVNRAPCEGIVTRISHRPGRYGLAFRKEVDKENERNHIVLERHGEKLLLVQIAGFLARRIHCWVHENDVLKRGQPVGMIAFGSRVDVYIPRDYEIMVKLNQKVKSGLTSLARKKGDS